MTAGIAFGGWYIREIIKDKRSKASEGYRDRRSKASEACREIRKIIGEWENTIRKAVESGKTGPDTCERIIESIRNNKFNSRLACQIPFVASKVVPDCGNVAILSLKFALTALKKKTTLVRILSPENAYRNDLIEYVKREVETFLNQIKLEGGPLVEELYRGEAEGWLRELICRPEADAALAIEDTLVGVVSLPGTSYDLVGPYDLEKEYAQRKQDVLCALLDLGKELKMEIDCALQKLSA